MTVAKQTDFLGILGGLGPLASAEFLKTIYEHNLGRHEQEAPRVILYSDPTFPKRTEAFFRGDADILYGRLTEALTHLCNIGVSKIVICCVTIHYLLPRLPESLRKRVVSLIEVIFDAVIEKKKRSLLICTNGTREMELFQSHRRWPSVQDYIALPDMNDQQAIHDLTEEIKRNRGVPEMISCLNSLLSKYQANCFIAGCTEVHLPAKRFLASNDSRVAETCIDPLTIIAKNFWRNSL